MKKDDVLEFWKSMHQKYPDIMKHFGQWIDEYKKEVKWSQLFITGVKFHDLPIELQQGVLVRYNKEAAEYFAEHEDTVGDFFRFIGELQDIFDDERHCRVCGCTDSDCSQCIEKTGQPCHWIEEDLCSACAPGILRPAHSGIILPTNFEE